MPSFPGWLAPMHFNPIRFEEFLSFAITVCGTWVGASLLVGGYKSNATSDLPTALARVSFTWLVSQPVAAAQLVLVTAAEGRSLVGASDFASKLPLAATGNTSVIASCTLASLSVTTLQEPESCENGSSYCAGLPTAHSTKVPDPGFSSFESHGQAVHVYVNRMAISQSAQSHPSHLCL